MTQAVVVRRDGDAFQARMFWRKAARLLDPESPITRVGFETGPKSFDDIWVEYDPSRSPLDHEGNPLIREHIQCKWHVSPDSYGFAQLIDPEFINANARSLLQRARAAQLAYAADGIGVRFQLLTNWRLDRGDALRSIVGKRSNAIRTDRLFGTKTDNSAMGALRKAWRDHLVLDDAELAVLARTLAFAEAPDSLEDWRDHLDALFGLVGLRRVPVSESAFFYDDLVFQWMAQGRLEFDRQRFRQACDRERLIGQGDGRPLVYGVKSFEHPVDRLQDRCAIVLDLVPKFDERFIRDEAEWSKALYPELRAFLLAVAKDRQSLRLALDAHTTLAFAAGSVLNIKSGREIELEQRTGARVVWTAGDHAPDPAWPNLDFIVHAAHEGGSEIAVAIGLAHDVLPTVQRFVQQALPAVGSVLEVKPAGGAGARSIACGRHAFMLAGQLTAQVKAERETLGAPVVHLFIAAPNGFTFFLGQQQIALGRIRLYEFDFEGERGGSYQPSLALPVTETAHSSSSSKSQSSS